MSVNGVTNQSYYYEQAVYTDTSLQSRNNTSKNTGNTSSVIYEKSSEDKTDGTQQIYSPNTSIIESMKADLAKRKQQLTDLVEKTLGKQTDKYSTLSKLFNDIQNGTLSIDQNAVEQAQEDISQDGYWGIEQTSDRIVAFAKALSGGDSSKADEMIDAVKKGFEQATNAWGDDLPEISQKTMDATLEKLNDWKNSSNSSETE